MNRVVLWIVGPPGVGKTTLVRALIGPLERIDLHLVGTPKWTVGDGFCAAGHYTGQTFDGADTVPYNGVQTALKYWDDHLSGKELTIFDGDRFSHKSVVERFKGKAARACLLLKADAKSLELRRAARGSKQNASWVKGRETKSFNFWQDNFSDKEPWGAEAFTPHGAPPGATAQFVRDWLRKL